MADEWIIEKRKRPTLSSLFGADVPVNGKAVKEALARDSVKGDSHVSDYERGVGIFRWRRGRTTTYEVAEWDEHRAPFYGPAIGDITTILEYQFSSDELDLAVNCFLTLLKNPLKSIKASVPKAIFFNGKCGAKRRKSRRRTKVTI